MQLNKKLTNPTPLLNFFRIVVDCNMKKLLIVLILFFSYDAFSQTAEDYFERAYDKAENGDYYGAISDYTKAIELQPDYADAYVNRGVAKRKLKDDYGAISDYTKALELNPDYAIAYSNRGNAKEDIGDLNGACSDWRKAANLGHANSKKWVANQCN